MSAFPAAVVASQPSSPGLTGGPVSRAHRGGPGHLPCQLTEAIPPVHIAHNLANPRRPRSVTRSHHRGMS